MSRVGKNPVNIPSGVEVKFDNGVVSVKGPKGTLQQEFKPGIGLDIEGSEAVVTRADESKSQKSMHGLYRALLQNMVVGVSEGYKIQQELVGVGYKAEAKGQILELNLGYSHDIFFRIPDEVNVTAVMEKGKNPIITLESYDKQLIGQVAAKIRSLRKPEPYKGKGIKFVGEVLRKKAGKSAAKK
jgi:large subunit ribosomal protein L6